MVLGTDRRILTLAMARMADALGNSFLIIVLPLYIASGEISLQGIVGTELAGFVLREETLIGLVLSLFGFLNSFGQPITGRLSDRTGRRRVFVLAGLAVFGVGSAAYPFLTSYWGVLLARALQGIGAALTIPATVALVNDYAASDAERGGNFGVFNTFRLLGFGFGPIIAGIVITGGISGQDVVEYALPGVLAAFGESLSGFAAAFGVAVAGAVVSFVLVLLYVTDPPASEAAASKSLSVAIRDPDGRGLDSVFVLGVGTFLMAVTIALFATLEAPIREHLNESTVMFGTQFAAAVIGNILLQVPVGRASDRYGRKRFIVLGFVLLVPSVLAQGYVSTPLAMLAARLFQGVSVAFVFAPGLALAGDLAKDRGSGTTLSVLTMAFGLGVAVGPLASGVLYNLGGLAAPFVFGAALAVVALVLTYAQVEETFEGTASKSGVPQD
ncbi:MFS transporter [Haloarculaceae archaeon H-GB2-1]|nr:MFS transporter [Haloarculaceae archaeon H-GB1-1]MEA5387749.1 MFS transporter [Haloarculaceae archaeon H-GB11]MEA5409241.1 MFS transporter [Haloarculaceae archaeon H-GB2-1]